MSGIFLKFLSSKLGMLLMAVAMVFIVGGIQQLRINSYQSDVAQLNKDLGASKITVKLKENENLELEAALITQGKKIKEMQVAAAADKKSREKNLLKVKFKHAQGLKKLNKGKGPADMNRWLKNQLN